ncbi:MAG: helix-hairpin-helix domain-containing protein [Deltaproteobacteria bacterium]|nr:helix-hairpin-helix domain-containing protein [Deltaproteobacteria bacterium]
MASKIDVSYVDAKGRVRWRRNDEVADQIKRLGDFLIIGGYEESHARRYGKLAHTISRYPNSVVRLHKEGRLGDIPGVGGTIAETIGEFLRTGTCSKMDQWAERIPRTVLELTAIPGLGAKTIRTLYTEHGIKSLSALRKALDKGKLDGARGIGNKTVERMQRFIAEQEPGSKRS